MHMAYLTASANGTLPANPRQIYYAARPEMLRLTELSSISSNYFTQTLLIAFMKGNPRLTAGWNIAWDDRGHFSEPHTSHEIGLGTLAVRGYIARLRAMERRRTSPRGCKPRPNRGRYSSPRACSGRRLGFSSWRTRARMTSRA